MRKLLWIGIVISLASCTLGWNSCNRTQVKPYNLALSTDGADPNGLLLNPLWGAQFNGLQGNTPGPGPQPLPSPNQPWSASQTDWDTFSDNNSFPPFGHFCRDGHENWFGTAGDRLRAGTYTGLLTWESHSDASRFNDDDYSFNLVPVSMTGGPIGAGLQLNEDHIHVEYNVSEVGDKFDGGETPWWHAFHHAVDNSGDKPTPFDMLTSRQAIVTGLFGMDTAHPPPGAGDSGGETEIHPIWAMAMRVKESATIDFDSADETYAFMARNWGDEGFCSSGQWFLYAETVSILLPWRPGANKLAGYSGEFSIVNPPDSNLPDNVSVTYAGSRGLLLTFKLAPQPQVVVNPDGTRTAIDPNENGTVTEGEIQLHWTGDVAFKPPPVQPLRSKGQTVETEGPEEAMQKLVAKMTPKQRAAFLAAIPAKRPSKHSDLVQMKPPVEVATLPVRPQNAPAPTIGYFPSKSRAQAEKAKGDALHAIFGETIPDLVEKRPGTDR